MVSIETYQSKYKSLWDNFVDQSKNGTFLFKRDFMDYHSSRFDDYSLLMFWDSKLIAIFPANKELTNLYSHNGLTYGGLLVQEDLKLNQFIFLFSELLKFCNAKSIEKIFIKEIPFIYNSLFSDELNYASFLANGIIYRKDVLSTIDLNSRIKISKDRIQGYKRGVKNNLKIVETNEFKEFWEKILIPNLKNKHSVSPVHSIEEIEKLKKIFNDNIRQFNVYKDGNIVAGSTIFQTKNVVHVQYISSNNEKNTLGSLDFLFHNLINETFSKFKFFDFGTSNEESGRKINSGLIYWKEGFGARSVTQNFYEFKTNNFNSLNDILI